MTVAVQSIAAQQQHYREVRARLWGNPSSRSAANSNSIDVGVRMLDAGLRLVRNKAEEQERRKRELIAANRARIERELAEAERKREEARIRRRALAELSKRPLPCFREIAASIPDEHMPMKQIAHLVLNHFEDITIADLWLRKKSVYLAHARHCVAAMLWIRKNNFCLVGKFLRRDHTTILHSARKMGVHP